MKILVFTETYLPTVNGVVNSIELFRHELEHRGHHIFIVTPHSNSEKFKVRSHVFRLLSLPVIAQPTHPIAWPRLSQVQAIVDEVKPDIIHVQGMFTTGWMGKKIAGRNKIPSILTYHTLLEGYAHYAGPLAFVTAPLMRWWSKTMANGFDVVITPTPSIAKTLKSYGVKTDTVALPTGIDIRQYHPTEKEESRKALDFDPNTVYILSVSRLAGEKNIDQLLIDFGRLQARQSNVHLLLAGDGPDRKVYENAVKSRGLSDYVTFLGMVQHDDLISYFVASDIFAFPSLTDTEGIVLVEAMASGLPTVGYNKLGPGDLIKNGENGLLSEPGTDQFFQHLHALAQNNDLREKLGLGGIREARRYSIEKTADQLEQLYKVLIDSAK